LKRKHEQSVIDGFFNHFQRKANVHQRQLVRCSMDGQDSIYGGDYLFTDNSRFVLAEFKYQEGDLVSESEKPRRLKLCRNLDIEEDRRRQSLICHYVGWSSIRQSTRHVVFNQYYPEVCNINIFGSGSNLKESEADLTSRSDANTLIDAFLSQKVGGNYYTFKKYTEWLYSIVHEEEGEMELMLDNPDSQQLQLIDFNSLQDLKLWLEHHQPGRKLGLGW